MAGDEPESRNETKVGEMSHRLGLLLIQLDPIAGASPMGSGVKHNHDETIVACACVLHDALVAIDHHADPPPLVPLVCDGLSNRLMTP